MSMKAVLLRLDDKKSGGMFWYVVVGLVGLVVLGFVLQMINALVGTVILVGGWWLWLVGCFIFIGLGAFVWIRFFPHAILPDSFSDWYLANLLRIAGWALEVSVLFLFVGAITVGILPKWLWLFVVFVVLVVLVVVVSIVPSETAPQFPTPLQERMRKDRDREISDLQGGLGALAAVMVLIIMVGGMISSKVPSLIFDQPEERASVAYSTISATTNYQSTRRAVSKYDNDKPWSGDNWPFTVSSGEIELVGCCSVVFRHASTVYAINGPARTDAEARGWVDLVDSGLWRDSPGGYGKIFIIPIINLGLSLGGR